MPMNLRTLWKILKDRGGWCATAHGVSKNLPCRSDCTTEAYPQLPGCCFGKLTLRASVFCLDSNALHNLYLTISVPFVSLTDGCCPESAWVGSRVPRNVRTASIVNIPQVYVCSLHDKQRPKPQLLPSGTVLTLAWVPVPHSVDQT